MATYNQRHIPGANGRGTNYVVSNDYVYIIQGPNCQVLNVKTGAVEKIFSLPEIPENKKPDWGYIGLYEDYLIGARGSLGFGGRVNETTTLLH